MQMEIQTRSTNHELLPEARLWQAVLVTTIEEWVSGPLRRRREAEQFLFANSRDFQLVCESAGMNAENLRSRLEKLRNKSELPNRFRARRVASAHHIDRFSNLPPNLTVLNRQTSIVV